MTESAATTRDPSKAKLAASIICSPVEADGLPVNYQQSFAIEVDRFGPEELNKALADFEKLTSLLREYPQEMTAIVNDVLVGRTEGAMQSASRIGLSETAFQERGGGLLWAAMIGLAAGAIFVAAATQHQ